MEIIGGLWLTVAVSVDAGTETDTEFATGATKVGDSVGAEIMQSKTWFTLWPHSLLIIRHLPSIHRLYKRLTNYWCSCEDNLDLFARKTLICCSFLPWNQECHFGAYQFL